MVIVISSSRREAVNVDLDALENLKMKIDLSSVGKPALIGLAMLLVMVAVTAGRFAIDAATATEIPIERTVAEDTDSSSQVSSGSDSSEVAQDHQVIYVHVSGAVRDSGLVELSSGARVADAIEAAGGPNDDAFTDAVNLARKVEDGEHVHLPSNAESERGLAVSMETAGQALPGVETNKVNINTAGEAELEELPGIGPSTAQKIIADRDANGPYKSLDDLKRVPGIGDKKYASLEDLICI